MNRNVDKLLYRPLGMPFGVLGGLPLLELVHDIRMGFSGAPATTEQSIAAVSRFGFPRDADAQT